MYYVLKTTLPAVYLNGKVYINAALETLNDQNGNLQQIIIINITDMGKYTLLKQIDEIGRTNDGAKQYIIKSQI